MAIISSSKVLFVRIAFLFALSYYCLKDVEFILRNSTLVAFSHSMNLPQLVINKHSSQLGLFSLLFFFAGLHDLIPLLEKNHTYFLSIVPTRLTFFFIVTGLSFYQEHNLYLHNNAVFAYGFIEIWTNFLIFTSLREERNTRFEEKERVLAADYYKYDENTPADQQELAEDASTFQEEAEDS